MYKEVPLLGECTKLSGVDKQSWLWTEDGSRPAIPGITRYTSGNQLRSSCSQTLGVVRRRRSSESVTEGKPAYYVIIDSPEHVVRSHVYFEESQDVSRKVCLERNLHVR